MTFSIRRATPADAERVADIARRNFTETFGHLYPPEDLAYFLDTSYIPAKQRELLDKYLPWLLAGGAAWRVARGLRKLAWTGFGLYWAFHFVH